MGRRFFCARSGGDGVAQIAKETGDASMKAPKITMPFMEEEPEVVTAPIPREALADRYVCARVHI